jgi:hypothetical protein
VTRHRAWPGFALFAVLAVLALFVLHGPLAGMAALAAMLVLVLASVSVLRGQTAETRRESDRTGLAGWFGGWF